MTTEEVEEVGFIDSDGNYYEGDNKGDDLVVPKRPDQFHEFIADASEEGGYWSFNVQLAVTIGSKEVKQSLQSAINERARTEGFSDGNSFILYAGFDNPFKTPALKFAQWEASVWAAADEYKNEVLAGTQPMVNGEAAVAMMPEYPA